MRNINEFKKLIESGDKMDLHIHSHFSDGELSPKEIIDKWIKDGYKIIAISDHDGLDGSKLVCSFDFPEGVSFVPAIEFDSEDALGHDLHILGYEFDFDAKPINDAVLKTRAWRDERNEKLFQAINEMGYTITWEEVDKINESRYIGKPTFAKVLINKGYAKDVSEAFSKIMTKIRDELNIRKRALPSKEVVDIIHASDGIVVLAHPIEQKKKGELWVDFQPRLLKILDTFVEYGIDGIECYHPSASEEQSKFLVEYAKKHNLLITRGSDFHSENKKRDYSDYHK